MDLQTVKTGGITWLEPLDPDRAWYWGSDYTSGDLYEAEELYRLGHPVRSNRLVLLRGGDARLFEPVPAREGRYFGRPAVDDGTVVILLADFPAGQVSLLRFEPEGERCETVVTLPLSEVGDCYNLMPHTAPLCLTRQAGDRFRILWPDRADFPIGPTESFFLRDGEDLYFSRWHEDPDYRVETVIRGLDGTVRRVLPGDVMDLPGGRRLLLV